MESLLLLDKGNQSEKSLKTGWLLALSAMNFQFPVLPFGDVWRRDELKSDTMF